MLAHIPKITTTTFLIGLITGCGSSSSDPESTIPGGDSLIPGTNVSVDAIIPGMNVGGDAAGGASWTIDDVAYLGSASASIQVVNTDRGVVDTIVPTGDFEINSSGFTRAVLSIRIRISIPH